MKTELKIDETDNDTIFWNNKGEIDQVKLFDFLQMKGIGQYYLNGTDHKNSDPIFIEISNHKVSEVNETYITILIRDFIIENISDKNLLRNVLHSLHKQIRSISGKNLNLLHVLKPEFIKDTKKKSYLFFENGVVEITAFESQLIEYKNLNGCVWKNDIKNFHYKEAELYELIENFEFNDFLKEITKDIDGQRCKNRVLSLVSIIGYLCHRYKNKKELRAIILLDAITTGGNNGRTGKTLICEAIGKVRTISIIDGKSFDYKGSFRFSGVQPNTSVMVFDDVSKNFKFEALYPLITTGIEIQKKYKDITFIPFDESPKIAITSNFLLKGEGSSYRGRVFEFEVSNTFTAEYPPIKKYKKRFFDDWNEAEWNMFYNLIARAIKLYLREGLIASDPINLKISRLISQTHSDFVEFAEVNLKMDVDYDKFDLYNSFIKNYPQISISQRTFTLWLRSWAEYIGAQVDERHSNMTRKIKFIIKPKAELVSFRYFGDTSTD